MRHTLLNYIIGAGLVILSMSCNKDSGPGRGQDISYRQTFEIPAGIGVFDVHHFYITGIPTKYAATLALANLTDAEVTRVTTIEGTISGLFGDANMEYIDRISVRAFITDPNNYLEIAYRDPSPLDPGNQIGLIPSLSDSKGFFNGERFSLDIVIWLRQTTQETTPVQLDLKMRAEY
jgi:hypothetical protein